MAASKRVLAEFFGASHTHVQRLRDAVSMLFMQRQALAVRALPPAKKVLLTVSFDETEMEGNVDGVVGVHHFMIIHGRLKWTDQRGRTKVLGL